MVNVYSITRNYCTIATGYNRTLRRTGSHGSNSKISTNQTKGINQHLNDNFNNLHYCDSYHNVKFETPDGLHYDTKTDQKIIDYITNNCIDYK